MLLILTHSSSNHPTIHPWSTTSESIIVDRNWSMIYVITCLLCILIFVFKNVNCVTLIVDRLFVSLGWNSISIVNKYGKKEGSRSSSRKQNAHNIECMIATDQYDHQKNIQKFQNKKNKPKEFTSPPSTSFLRISPLFWSRDHSLLFYSYMMIMSSVVARFKHTKIKKHNLLVEFFASSLTHSSSYFYFISIKLYKMECCTNELVL